MNRKGFTMVELILVIAILGILAVSALPKFLSLSTDAGRAARDGVVGAVRSGIALYRANNAVEGGGGDAPGDLEDGGCCFGEVLENPVGVDDGWNTSDNVTYTHSAGGVSSSYNYNATNGTFTIN